MTHRKKELSARHECIEFCCKPISDIARSGLVCTTAGGKEIVFTLLHASDRPEREELLGLNRGVQTTKPSHLFLIKREALSLGRPSAKRTLTESLNILSGADENG